MKKQIQEIKKPKQTLNKNHFYHYLNCNGSFFHLMKSTLINISQPMGSVVLLYQHSRKLEQKVSLSLNKSTERGLQRKRQTWNISPLASYQLGKFAYFYVQLYSLACYKNNNINKRISNVKNNSFFLPFKESNHPYIVQNV